VAHAQNETRLLAYALEATTVQVEERCRQLRNVEAESVDVARRAWERRSLTVTRNPEHGTLLISVEVPVEDGELIVRALESVVAAGEVALGVDYRPRRKREPASLRRGRARGGVADHYQVIVHVDEKSLNGGVGRSDLLIETVRRLTWEGSLSPLVEVAARRSRSGASSRWSRRRRSGCCGRGIGTVPFRPVPGRGMWKRTISGIGPTAGRRLARIHRGGFLSLLIAWASFACANSSSARSKPTRSARTAAHPGDARTNRTSRG
jgi:hypothetical protein